MEQSKIKPIEPQIEGIKTAFFAELSTLCGSAKAQEITEMAWKQFQTNIPLIPDVSEKSPWIKNIIVICFEIGIWRQLEAEGMSLYEISALTCKILTMALSKLPPKVIENSQNMMLSGTYVGRIADDSEKLDSSCNWKIKAIYPTESDTFDIGMDILLCPVIALCNNLGVARYAPYLCQNDYATHSAFGIRLIRTRTLAEGGDRCDFRLSKEPITTNNI